MFERTFFLALLFAFLTAPVAMAEEIGGGSPDSSTNGDSLSQPEPAQSESSSGHCFTDVLLQFFFGDI